MATSFSFILDSGYGKPLEEYLGLNHIFSLVKHPVDRVLSAIKTIARNEPPEVISDATLEAILSVAYYPQYLKLLAADLYAPLYEILDIYLDHYAVSISTLEFYLFGELTK